jgi:uncharacterized membrane protein YfcA
MTDLVLALTSGGVVGLTLGGLGGGGSVLAVPALIYLLGFTPADATTAALVIVALTSVTSLAGHAREGGVAWRTGLLLAAAGIAPAALAGAAAGHLPQEVLTAGFAVVAVLAALRMLRPAAPAPPGAAHPARAGAAGAGLGAVTGFLGVGGGFLAVPVLVGVLKVPMRRAVGTSLLVITVNAVAALAARSGSGGGSSPDWAAVAPFTAAAVLGAWDGRRLAAKATGTALQRLFAWVLLSVAALMLVDALV